MRRCSFEQKTMKKTNEQEIAKMDLRERRLVRKLRAGSDPEQFAVSPDGQFVYVTCETGGEVFIIQPAWYGRPDSRRGRGSTRSGYT